MKNQIAKFTSQTESTLTISLYQGKQSIKVTARQQTPGEKTLVGCKDYFDLGQDDEAQRMFDQRVKEATTQGWVVNQQRRERKSGFTAIPPAPVAAAVVATATPTSAPRAAARR